MTGTYFVTSEPALVCSHMQLLVPLVAALVPLLITPGLCLYFDITPKIAILLLCVGANSLISRMQTRPMCERWSAARGPLVRRLCLPPNGCRPRSRPALSTNRALSLHGGTWRRYGLLSETGLLLFVLLAAGWLARDQGNIRSLLEASTLAGALAALYGIAQYFGLDPLLPSSAYEVGDEPFRIVRPPGTLGHADYFADWLVTVAFLALALGALEKERWRIRGALATALLAALAIVLTGTRAALLGLFAGAVVFILARRTRFRAREVALCFACAAGLVLFFFSPPGAKLRARLHWSIEDASGGARLLLWRDSLRMASRRPLSGFGPETFATDFPRFESLELARTYPDFYHESPHNHLSGRAHRRRLRRPGCATGACADLGTWAAVKAWRSGAPLRRTARGRIRRHACLAQQFSVFIFTTSLYFHLLIALLIVTVLPRQNRAETAQRSAIAVDFPIEPAR